MHQDGAVVRSKVLLAGQCWFATTWQAAQDVLRDQERFGRDPRRAGKRQLPGMKWWMPKYLSRLANNMLAVDGAEHRRLRSLVDQAFLRQEVEALREPITDIVDRLLSDIESKGRRTENGGVDLLPGFCRQLPLTVICEVLGLPAEDRPKFERWFKGFAEVRSGWGLVRMIPSLMKLLRYLDQQFKQVRRQPRAGLMTTLVQMEADGDQLNHDELVSIVFLLLVAGHETTVHLLSTSIYSLLTHPEQLAQLQQDWTLAPSAVEETLRFNSPVQMSKPRFVLKSGEFHGVQLQRGDYILAMLGAANADPAKFDRPEQFDIRRAPNPHLAFGSGIHVCLGLKLAKAETEIALQHLFTRYPALRLAVPPVDVPWASRVGMRCIKQLSVQLLR